MADVEGIVTTVVGMGALGVGLRTAATVLPVLWSHRSGARIRSPRFPGEQVRHHLLHRQSGILGRFKDDLRHADGGFTRVWRFPLEPSFLAQDQPVEQRYDALARMLSVAKPAGTVVSVRLSNQPDPGTGVAAVLAAQCPPAAANPAARELFNLELEFQQRLAQGDSFRRTQALCLVRVPPPAQSAGQELSAAVRRIGDSFRKHGLAATLEAGLVTNICQRTRADEERAYRAACETFRVVENECPTPLQPLTRSELEQAVFFGHRPTATVAPTFPSRQDVVDFQPYLSTDTVEFHDWYALHGGALPVARISLFVPPQPIRANTLRDLLASNRLTFPHTVVAEFVYLDVPEAKAELDKRRKALKYHNTGLDGVVRYNIDSQLADQDLVQVRTDVGRRVSAYLKARFYVLVYGPPTTAQADRETAVKELERRCEEICKVLRGIEGVDCQVERDGPLQTLYQRSLLGEATPAEDGSEISEVAKSLACLIPTEDAWRGSANPHFLFQTVTGRQLPFNLFDYNLTPSPVVLFLGSPGCGKTMLMEGLITSFLANCSHARVIGFDFGQGLGSLARLTGGYQVRFELERPTPINIWYYDELADGQDPDDEQKELVTAFYLLLAGITEADPDAKYYRAMLSIAVKEVYANVVPGNRRPGVAKQEPVLSDLLGTIRSYPFESHFAAHKSLLLGFLQPYVGHPWLDQPTHGAFQGCRFLIFEADSVETFPKTLKEALIFAAGTRVVRSIGRKNPDGTRDPLIAFFEEMWKVKEKYPFLLSVINQGARQGRTNFTKLFLLTHSIKDVEDLWGVLQAAAIKLFGAHHDQQGMAEYRERFGLSAETCAAIRNLKNTPGVESRFVLSLATGHNPLAEPVAYRATPLGLWRASTAPIEKSARETALRLRPDLSEYKVLLWLAAAYPQGLVRAGLAEIDQAALAAARL